MGVWLCGHDTWVVESETWSGGVKLGAAGVKGVEIGVEIEDRELEHQTLNREDLERKQVS